MQNYELRLLIDIIALSVLTIQLIRAIKSFLKTESIVPLIYFIFFIIYAYPIVFLALNPNYVYPVYFKGFNIVTSDINTVIFSDALIVILSLTFPFKNYNRNKKKGVNIINKNLNIPLFILIYSPFIYLLFTGKILLFIDYAAVSQSNRTGEISSIYTNIFNLSMFSLIISGIYLNRKYKINKFEWGAIILSMFLISLFNGKRYIVFFCVLVLIFSLYKSYKFNKMKLIVLAASSSILLMLYTYIYMRYFKGNSIVDVNIFEVLFIDLSRLDRLRMSIYSILYPEKLKILQYPGQTFLYNILFFIPRAFWQSKPYPYSPFISYSVMFFNSNSVSYEYIMSVWYLSGISGMTSNIIDELVANFSWVSFLILPLIFRFVLRRVEKNTKVSNFIVSFLIIYALIFAINPIIFWGFIIVSVIFNNIDYKGTIKWRK